MLQIGVDQHSCSATSIGKIKTRQHGGFFAEIAGELQQCQALIGVALLPGANHRHRSVRGSVIDQEKTVHLGKGKHPFDKTEDHRFFVQTSGHDPELLAAHANSAVMHEP